MRIVVTEPCSPGGAAILEPMAQNWLAGDASRVEPLREPTVPPRRQVGDEADPEGSHGRHPDSYGGHRDGRPARQSKRTGLSAWAQNTRSCGPMTITPTRQPPRHNGGSLRLLGLRLGDAR
jgi:hypothetical protein